ncbi:WXG100 family type VII secretion target [Nocardia sp. SSK8]|uniref:WXG100 family type VII secretion target n=1 Tax=Nocardia sp. SSK8 TaxID=3120154 RepID=UPI00300B2C30
MRSISGTDPDYAPVVEVFDNLSHAEIHRAVQQLDPAALAVAGDAFLSASTGLGDEVDNAHGEIRAALADGWRGAAAQQAVDAVSEFEQAGRRIADVLTAVGVRLARAGDAAESVRAAIAEPDAAQPDPAAALLDSQQAADNATVVRQAENARLDAVRAMETIYGGALVPTGSGVPSFPVLDTATATAPGTGTPPTTGAPAVTLTGANPAMTDPSTTTTGETQVAGVVTVLPGDTTAGTPGQPQTPATGTTPATTAAPGTVPAAAAPTTLAATQPGQVTTASTTAATAGSPATTPGYVAGSVPGTDPRNRRDRSGKPADASATGGSGNTDDAPTTTPLGAGAPATGATAHPGDATVPAASSPAIPSATVAHPETTAAGTSPAVPTATNAHPDTTAAGTSPAGTTATDVHPDTASGASPADPTAVRPDTAGTTPAADTGAAATEARTDRDPAAAGGEAAAGMSAGAIGGLMGGAMAAADNQRAPGGPRHPAPPEEPEDEDDEFLRFLDEEPTYLEPADEVNALIGRMEPTSPAVLGEWTERE